jgi:predicted membrane channel-forming protein YqfA (hemolysin III family)
MKMSQMPKRKLQLIAKICPTLAFLCLIIDMLTATAIYLLDPATFYQAETNIPFRNFLVYQTPQALLTFLIYFAGNLCVLTMSTLYLHCMARKTTQPLLILEKAAFSMAILVLIYASTLNLYGAISNIRCILIILGGG